MWNVKTDQMDQWSVVGVEYAKRGADIHCPTCGAELRGQRYCPNCGTKIMYEGETEKSIKTDERLATLARGGEKMSAAGDSLSRTGCQTMGCVGFIILIFLLFLLL
ncbi:hypothetical protein EFT87_04195 [Schleiferilactobacillus harbinensis]|uniref:DUF2089 domain-containing protein n=1 Tax=Schleiferilactobacillus harbinensis TaxID=304207 RepID=UPI0021A5BAAD|nr:DUF2089 domain-containing protein [Schleiferilactobacillus harbinensis]MCT2907860.1 hypothetical protein [Schleiferilactobacillus harbinensis]